MTLKMNSSQGFMTAILIILSKESDLNRKDFSLISKSESYPQGDTELNLPFLLSLLFRKDTWRVCDASRSPSDHLRRQVPDNNLHVFNHKHRVPALFWYVQ